MGHELVVLPDSAALAKRAAEFVAAQARSTIAARSKFTKELTTEQKVRFLARIGARSLHFHPNND